MLPTGKFLAVRGTVLLSAHRRRERTNERGKKEAGTRVHPPRARPPYQNDVSAATGFCFLSATRFDLAGHENVRLCFVSHALSELYWERVLFKKNKGDTHYLYLHAGRGFG